MNTTMTEYQPPRIFAGCPICRENGVIVGGWFDATEADAVTSADVHGYAVAAHHDQLCCFDLVGFPSGMTEIGEMSMHEAQLWADVLTSVDEHLRPALLAWVDSGRYIAVGNGAFPCIDEFDDRYCGQWRSFEEFAEQIALNIGLLEDMPDNLVRYFDADAWLCDLGDSYFTAPAPDGEIYVYRMS